MSHDDRVKGIEDDLPAPLALRIAKTHIAWNIGCLGAYGHARPAAERPVQIDKQA
jgi:hypothetical protein